MKRRLLNLLTALSLLLCVAAAALWVRSYWARDVFARTNHQVDGYVVSNPGRGGGIEWSRRRVKPPAGSVRRLAWHSAARDDKVIYAGIRPTRLGFGAERFAIDISTSRGTERMDWSGVVVPHWALLVVFGTLPAARGSRWAVRRWNRAKAPAAPCPRCGYDLRATPDRCPECGTVTPAQTAA